jgi:hypothetical protein
MRLISARGGMDKLGYDGYLAQIINGYVTLFRDLPSSTTTLVSELTVKPF